MRKAPLVADNAKSEREPMGQFWTISNVFSLSRVFLLVPIFIFLGWGSKNHGNLWAALFMGIAALTDFLDGLMARWFNQTTRWGRILDPLCDKVCIVSIAIFLALPTRAHPIPVWFLGLVVLRDVLIVIGAYYVMGRFRHIPSSIVMGKWNTFLMALLLISYTLEWSPQSPWLYVFRMEVLLWICTGMIVLSGILYARRTIRGDFPGVAGIRRSEAVTLSQDKEVEKTVNG
jgi:cardiolipin synthase